MDHKAVIKSASIYNTKKTELVAVYKTSACCTKRFYAQSHSSKICSSKI